MIIQNSAVNIMFSRCENIKKQYILNEEILKERFNEASILPIPDEAPSEIPRVIVKTKGEHSQLNIAPEAVNFQTVYSDDYTQNWELCEEYIKSRIENIFKLTDKFTAEQYKYIGIVTNLIWDNVSKDGNKILFNNLFGIPSADNLDDLVVKYTYIEKEKYYANITLQSARIYKNSNVNEAGSFVEDNLEAHTIGITLDINDRYAFNMQKGYLSNKANFDELLNLTTVIINSKLKNLVEKGAY